MACWGPSSSVALLKLLFCAAVKVGWITHLWPSFPPPWDSVFSRCHLSTSTLRLSSVPKLLSIFLGWLLLPFPGIL